MRRFRGGGADERLESGLCRFYRKEFFAEHFAEWVGLFIAESGVEVATPAFGVSEFF